MDLHFNLIFNYFDFTRTNYEASSEMKYLFSGTEAELFKELLCLCFGISGISALDIVFNRNIFHVHITEDVW